MSKRSDSALWLLDGAMGTQLQALGMPSDVCPELWALEHPEFLQSIHRPYAEAGSQRILSCTFGANRKKLARYGVEDEFSRLNRELVRLAKEAAPDCEIGGDIGPLGELLEPMGSLSFDDAITLYAEQAQILTEAGVDCLVIETMIDIQEARAALIGCKQVSELPVEITLTFENGYTLTGTDPATALITLQGMGAAAVGCNCGSGPADMRPLIEAMVPYAEVPLIAKPNAGLPQLVDGQTVFSASPSEFAHEALVLAETGARLSADAAAPALRTSKLWQS